MFNGCGQYFARIFLNIMVRRRSPWAVAGPEKQHEWSLAMINNTNNWKRHVSCFLTAQTISLFGSSLVQYAIVWYITLTTSSGKMLTLSTLCGFLPQIGISLFAGVWIDCYNRKWMIMIPDLVIAAATLALATAFWSGHRQVWFLFAALAVRSAGTGIQTPAVNSVIPQMVPREHLMRVSGINSTLSSLTMFLAPAASGALMSVAPLEEALMIDVMTAAVGVGITAFVRIQACERKNGEGATALEELREGFDYLRNSPFVRRLLVFQVTVLFLISPSAFLTPLMVSRTFGPEVWRLTASEMTYSLGMVAGGLLITAWGGFGRRLDTTLLAGAVYGGIMIGLGMAPVFGLYLVFNMAIGITSPCYNSPITVSIQERVEPAMHGRVFSLMQISTACALPLGMAVFGPAADLVPVQLLLAAAGAAVLAVTGAVWITGAFYKNCVDTAGEK